MSSVVLAKRLLPEFQAKDCEGLGGSTPSGGQQWETPVLSFPLTYVGGGDSDCALGEVVGSVRISFSMDTDPADIQGIANMSGKSLMSRVADPVKDLIQKADQAKADAAKWMADVASCDMVKDRARQIDMGHLADVRDAVMDKCKQIDMAELADAASCDIVKERCRQIDMDALTDAGCELVKDGRPLRQIGCDKPESGTRAAAARAGPAPTTARSSSGSSLGSVGQPIAAAAVP